MNTFKPSFCFASKYVRPLFSLPIRPQTLSASQLLEKEWWSPPERTSLRSYQRWRRQIQGRARGPTPPLWYHGQRSHQRPGLSAPLDLLLAAPGTSHTELIFPSSSMTLLLLAHSHHHWSMFSLHKEIMKFPSDCSLPSATGHRKNSRNSLCGQAPHKHYLRSGFLFVKPEGPPFCQIKQMLLVLSRHSPPLVC